MGWLSKKSAGVCLGGFVLLYATLAFTAPKGYWLALWGNLSQALFLLLIVAAMLLNVRRGEHRTRLFWGMFASGGFLWFLGQLQWVYFEGIKGIQPPNPSPGDVVIFLHVLPMVAATALQPQAEVSQEERTMRLGYWDFLLLASWWIFLYGYIVFPHQYILQNDRIFGSTFNFLYAIQNITLIATLGWLWIQSHGTWKKVFLWMLLGAASYSLSSLVINIFIDVEKYYTGGPTDIPLVVSMALFTYAGVWAYCTDLTQQPALITMLRQAKLHSAMAKAAVLSLPFFAAAAIGPWLERSQIGKFRLLLTLSAMLVFLLLLFLQNRYLNQKLSELLAESKQSYDDLQRLQGHLLQAEKLASIGQLVSGAARELHEPLSAISLCAEALVVSPRLDEQQRSYAAKVTEQARRTRQLITNLLAFAKQSPIQRSAVDLNDITEKAMMLHQLNIGKRDVETMVQTEPGLPLIFGDEGQLLQVFMHILNNAADAVLGHDAKPCILLRTESDGKSVRWICSDTGPGIEHPDRIFDPFYTTKPVGKGTGLGLSACYGIVRDHGGEISCHNRIEGGATFVIELPVAKTESSAERPVKAAKR